MTKKVLLAKGAAYRPFCADFGPINLGLTHHFIEILAQVLSLSPSVPSVSVSVSVSASVSYQPDLSVDNKVNAAVG